MKVNRSLFLLAMMLASPVLAAEGPGLDALFSELTEYDSGKSPAVLEQIRVQVRRSYGNPSLRLDLDRRMIAVLEAEKATVEAKQFACKQLGRIGTDASLAPLATLLKDERSAADAVFALLFRVMGVMGA